jgi:glycosyltransferase involved in cell wall biosynthesis
MSQIIFKTSRLIVPSNYWRNYLINNFQVNPLYVNTTHEAVDPKFFPISKKYFIKPRPYILYTGNLYPHKNIKVIIEALRLLPDLKLKIICARSIFQQRLEKLINDYQIQDQVKFLGYVPDSDFKKIYSHALALVHPAFIEGFSLTGLEAMALNCPVIASNTSCLPEIYQDSVLFFNPNKPQELVNQIKLLKDDLSLRRKLIHLGHLQVRKYSWTKTAQETMSIYRQLLQNA